MDMILELLKAALFGVVQGITEWLPISSTGHMILLDEFVKLNMSPEFMEMFFVVIQLGAIFAVMLLFWGKLFPFSFSNGIHIKRDVLRIWPKIIVAGVPAGVVGILWNTELNALFFNPLVVIIMLALLGILFIVVETRNKGITPKIQTTSEITYKAALWIGIFQLVAMIFPGASRSGSTIIGALLIGVSRVAAAEFTFLLAVPVMFGASFIRLMEFGFVFSGTEIAVLFVGMVVAFFVSLVTIRFLMAFIRKRDFKIFGWYRIILAAVVALYFIFTR